VAIPPELAPLQPLNTQTLTQQAVDTLHAYILARAKDTTWILPSQGELTRMLGVSRTVLREAMNLLQARGLVSIEQGKRMQVKPVGPEAAIVSLDAMLQRTEGSLLHLVEVRRPLESEIAALAAERADEALLLRAEESVRELAAAQTLEAQIAADTRFHRLLAEATGNPVFVALLDTVAGLLRVSRDHTIGTFGVHAALEGHRDILAALRRRDPKGARDAMLRHLQWNELQIREGRP